MIPSCLSELSRPVVPDVLEAVPGNPPDMEEGIVRTVRTFRERNVYVLCLLGIFALSALVALSFLSFRRENRERIQAVNNAYLEEIARQSNLRISIRINAGIAYTAMFADLFSSVKDLTGSDAAGLLRSMAGHYDFHDVRVFLPGGEGRDPEGPVSVEPDEPWFREALYGRHGVRFVRNAHAPDNLLFYSPIVRNGEIVGVVAGVYDMAILSRIMDLSYFHERGYSNILTSSGESVTTSRHTANIIGGSENGLEAFEAHAVMLDGSTFEGHRAMLRDGTSGFIRFAVGGQGRTAYITPMDINDWRLVTIVPDAVTEDICDPINRSALSFSIKLFLAFAVCAVLISFVIFRTRREVAGVNQERDSMADISPSGIVKCTRDGFRMLYINQGCLDLAGYSREELEDAFGNQFIWVVHPDDRERLAALMRECGMEPLQCEYRIVTRSGEVKWILHRMRLAADRRDEVCLYCSMTDITDAKEAELKLRMSNERFLIAISHTNDTLFEYAYATGRIVRIAGEGAALKGVSLPEMMDEIGMDGESRKAIEAVLEALRAGEASASVVVRAGDGSPRWFRITLTNLFDDENRPYSALGTQEDITDLKEAEIRFAREERYREAMLSKTIASYSVNVTRDRLLSRYADGEEQGVEHPDASVSALFRRAVELSVHPEDRPEVLRFYSTESLQQLYAAGQGETSLEYRTLRGDAFIWVSSSINLLKDPASGDLLAFGYLTDITERRRREAELVYKSERDFLTGLYNRSALEKRFSEYASSEGCLPVFFSMDLDGFKNVNDTLGHLEGDTLLQLVARELESSFRENDIVGRLGGDEFLAIMQGVPAREDIERKAEELRARIRGIRVEHPRYSGVSVSIGVAIAPNHGSSFEELYAKADIALYHAKQSGRDRFVIYGGEDGRMPRPGRES